VFGRVVMIIGIAWVGIGVLVILSIIASQRFGSRHCPACSAPRWHRVQSRMVSDPSTGSRTLETVDECDECGYRDEGVARLA
jgi:C4-type Zn-finger protein